MIRIGSLYSGIGGLCQATEWATGGKTMWQLDRVNAAVRARHFDALQIEADVATADPDDLPAVAVLVAGFACQDLSVAGKGDGLLAGSRTGPTYRHLLRFAGARLTDDGFEVDRHRRWLPDVVVMENVPPLLSRWREVLEEHWRRLGYGLTWVRARALDAGHPHRRARVFVVAERGGRGRGVSDVPRDGEWTPERGERVWGTPRVGNGGVGGERENDRGRIEDQVQVRPWPTATATDYKTPAGWERPTDHPPARIGEALLPPPAEWGRRLSADWTEALLGYPSGWTIPEGPRLELDPDAPAVRGRYPETWDRSEPWPGFAWEPARTLPDGPPCPGRPARIMGVGNAVCPQQGRLAIEIGLAGRHVAGLTIPEVTP